MLLPGAASVRCSATGRSGYRPEERFRVLDALYISTRYPDSLTFGPHTNHFDRLQSPDPTSHAFTLVEAIRLALATF